MQAQEHMRRLADLKDNVEVWRSLESDVEAANGLCDLIEAEADPHPDLEEDLVRDVEEIQNRLARLEFHLAFQGPHDRRNAMIGIHAGAGGVESQDFAEMLLRMYLRWAERRGFSTEILDASPGEGGGIKSVVVETKGRYVYGNLRSERGVHRLVRLSPFDADHLRHTSFVLVEVMPEADAVEVHINEADLRIDYFRASGAGGQNVQKNSTAVRLVHEPSGITVSVQNERSQRQNRETAMKILQARLMEVEVQKQAEEQARIKGDHVSAGWGNQIRSYVLHPYKMVKDHRTGQESRNPTEVLDGGIDDFITAYLNEGMGASA